jgi:hypothetical protein
MQLRHVRQLGGRGHRLRRGMRRNEVSRRMGRQRLPQQGAHA